VVDNYVPISLAILGAAVSNLGGNFGFLWTGITKLRDDVRHDVDQLKGEIDSKAKEHRQAVDQMNDAIERKAGEHRQAQSKLWSEIRLFEQRSTDHRSRIQERIGELPTRDEMKAARDEMRQDLKAMESRIRDMIHPGSVARGLASK
jgi:hypothetical protein